MKKAGAILDLPADRVEILGRSVDLDLTTAGHYAQSEEKLEQCLIALPRQTKEEGCVVKATQTVQTSVASNNEQAVEGCKV